MPNRTDELALAEGTNRLGDSAMTRGVIPALVTPFTEDQSIDLSCLQALAGRLVDANVHGLVVAAGQGEGYALSASEMETVTRVVSEAVGDVVPVIAGVSAHATLAAVDLAIRAERAGAAAIISLPPHFAPLAEREIVAHFTAVADAVQIPLIIYHHPTRTNTWLSPQLVAELAGTTRTIAVKESSGDLAALKAFREVGTFDVCVGHDALVLDGLMAGASGTISASANVFPRLFINLYDAVREGRVDDAQLLQTAAGRFREAFSLGSFPVVVKEALGITGFPVGPCRRPVAPLSADADGQLRTIVESIRATEQSTGGQ
jgi:4-hydroxy-tetrahydrodipicolinate synthase